MILTPPQSSKAALTLPQGEGEKTIWVLVDDRPGNYSQALGLGEKLSEILSLPLESKKIQYNFLAKLPLETLDDKIGTLKTQQIVKESVKAQPTTNKVKKLDKVNFSVECYVPDPKDGSPWQSWKNFVIGKDVKEYHNSSLSSIERSDIKQTFPELGL